MKDDDDGTYAAADGADEPSVAAGDDPTADADVQNALRRYRMKLVKDDNGDFGVAMMDDSDDVSQADDSDDVAMATVGARNRALGVSPSARGRSGAVKRFSLAKVGSFRKTFEADPSSYWAYRKRAIAK